MLDHRADQTGAAARNQNVKEAVRAHHRFCAFTGGVVQQIHRVGRQTDGIQRPAHDVCQHQIRAQCLAAAAQNTGVPGFQAERRSIHCDVRPRFKNDADHAKRHALFADDKAIGARRHGKNFSRRIRECGNFIHTVGNGRDAGGRQTQTVNHHRANAVFFRSGDIQRICGENRVCLCAECRRNSSQRRVFLPLTGGCELCRSGARTGGNLFKIHVQPSCALRAVNSVPCGTPAQISARYSGC